MKKYLLTACLSLTVVTTVVAQTPKTYELTATPATTFYRFLDATTKPVLTINSGDRIRVSRLAIISDRDSLVTTAALSL